MKKTGFALLIILALFSCKDKNIPDVSGIRINQQVLRFEQDFFKLDTNNLLTALTQLNNRYPDFLGDYLHNILELPPITDTSIATQALIKKFIADYKPVKDSADKLFANFDPYEKQVKQGLQFVKYYFPAYKAPEKLITFIGPLEGYSDVITMNALAVGLQLHLGKDFSLYTSNIGQQVYPVYISRRFTPEYIPVNCIKNIISDIAPEKAKGKSLVELMVEKGKRLYVLDKLMPYTADTIKIGYTGKQLQGCYENEGKIWNFFLVNNLVYTNEPSLLSGYLEDAPNTPEMGNDSPGAIGVFVGWQIVKKYMEKNPSLSLNELLNADNRKIFEDSKYKPN